MAIFVQDSFTGTTATALVDHTGEVGATWALNPGGNSTAALDGSGHVVGVSGSAWYVASGVPATNEYDVTVDANFTPVDTSFYLGLRGSATDNSGYLIGWGHSGTWDLYKNLGVADSTTGSLAAGAHTFRATIRNSGGSAVLTLYVDNTQVYSYTDSSPVTAIGRAGFYLYTISGSPQLDSFQGDDLTGAGLTAGGLVATGSPTAITLSVTSPLTGGSGSGYQYTLYRGTAPNFTVGSGSLLTTVSSLPHVDSTASPGMDYYYRAIGTDNDAGTVNIEPAGLTGLSPTDPPFAVCARLLEPTIAVVFIGDSITYGVRAGLGVGPCAEACAVIGARSLPRTVVYANQGISGSQAADWTPSGTYYRDALSPTSTDNSGAYQLTQANPFSQLVISICLGPNDSANAVPAATYGTHIGAIVTQARIDWPDALIVLHAPIWYSPNARTSLSYDETSLALLTQYAPELAALTDGVHVWLGDTSGYAHFAATYRTELDAESGSDGTYFIHPNAAGNTALGKLWGTALATILIEVTSAQTSVYVFRRRLSRSR